MTASSPEAQDLLDRLLLGGGRKVSPEQGLADLRRVLSALDNPQKHLPPVIHVAGTNGKGSTVALIRALAEAHGLAVHTHTSPHLRRVTERICPRGEEIAPEYAMHLLGRLMAAEISLGVQLGFSQRLLGMAAMAFAEADGADLTLIETGLGGRLDPTNILPGKVASVITSIGLDHMHLLGDTVARIAVEKAGIFRPGVPAILARQPHADALQALRDSALHYGSPVIEAVAQRHGDGTWSLPGLPEAAGLPPPALLGPHQIDNAATALATFAAICPGVLQRDKLLAALQQVRWPGRLHPVADGPLIAHLPAGSQLWVDGAHNPEAMAPVAAALPPLLAGRKLQVIMTVGSIKTVAPMLAALAPITHKLIALDYVAYKEMMPADDLAAAARACGITNTVTAPDLTSAMGLLDNTPSLVLVTGSLYLVGDLLSDHVPAPPHPAL